MKIKEACEFADECGVETIGEAILNIELHAVSLFSLDEISNELNELHEDAKNYDMDDSVLTVIQEV